MFGTSNDQPLVVVEGKDLNGQGSFVYVPGNGINDDETEGKVNPTDETFVASLSFLLYVVGIVVVAIVDIVQHFQ